MFNPYFLVMLLSVTVASCSQILLKKSTFCQYRSVIREYLNWWVIGGYAMLFGSMLLTVCAYSGLDYKNGPVIEALGNVLVPTLSVLIFRERMTLRKILGMGCIIAGIVVFYS